MPKVRVQTATIPSGAVASNEVSLGNAKEIGLEIPSLSGVTTPNLSLQVAVPAGSFRNLLKRDASGDWGISATSGGKCVALPDISPFTRAKVVMSLSGEADNTFKFVCKE